MFKMKRLEQAGLENTGMEHDKINKSMRLIQV